MSARRFCFILLPSSLILLGSAAPAFGHKLNVTATPVPPASLRVEAGYDDDTPAEGATVVVTDETGAEVGRGTADERGVCVVPRPAGRWAVAVDDGAGHRTSVSGEAQPASTTGGLGRWAAAGVGVSLVAGWAVWRRVARR